MLKFFARQTPVPQERAVVVTPAVEVVKPRVKAVPVVPVPHVAVAMLDSQELTEYNTLCAEMGFAPRTLLEARIMSFCAENAIEVYTLSDVQEYMNRMFKRESEYSYAGWGWWPMRAKEIALMPTYHETKRDWGNYNKDFGGGTARGIRTSYPSAIPLPVLLTARSIEQAIPEIEGFVVAAPCEVERKEDPFLGVLVDIRSAPIIIERWDEPGFRSKTKIS